MAKRKTGKVGAEPDTQAAINRGGRPRKAGKLVPVVTIKSRNEAWKDWLDRFAASEAIPTTELIDAALATHAALRRFEAPPKR